MVGYYQTVFSSNWQGRGWMVQVARLGSGLEAIGERGREFILQTYALHVQYIFRYTFNRLLHKTNNVLFEHANVESQGTTDNIVAE